LALYKIPFLSTSLIKIDLVCVKSANVDVLELIRAFLSHRWQQEKGWLASGGCPEPFYLINAAFVKNALFMGARRFCGIY